METGHQVVKAATHSCPNCLPGHVAEGIHPSKTTFESEIRPGQSFRRSREVRESVYCTESDPFHPRTSTIIHDQKFQCMKATESTGVPL